MLTIVVDNIQPRSQGTFPGFGGVAKPTSKAREKRPGDEVKQHRLCEHSLRESIWAQKRTGVPKGDTREWRETGVSLARAVLSLAHYFQAPATQAILNNNK